MFPRKIRFGWNAGRMNQRYEGSLWAFPGVSTPQNRTISVNLGIFRSLL